MGISSSTEQHTSVEQREVETLAASTGALPMLHKAFSKLSDPHTHTIPIDSLKECFCVRYKDAIFETPTKIDSFSGLFDHLGMSIIEMFFPSNKDGLSWVEFVRGYVSCCGRMTASMSLYNLLRVYAVTAKKVGLPLKLEFESDAIDGKVTGFLLPRDALMLLWLCWAMVWNVKSHKYSRGVMYLPDISNLVLSAVVSCSEGGKSLDVWDCDVFSLEVQIPAGKFLAWVVGTLPGLADCLVKFISESLQNCSASQDETVSSNESVVDVSTNVSHSYLLTRGKAWAISLSSKSSISGEILRHCFSIDGDEIKENLLYRSSFHGKGLNRFWSNIEGYYGPLLMLVVASRQEGGEDSAKNNRWTIGALIQEGFENRDQFYGSSGHLYAIDPVFSVILPSGKEKNFVYSHLHPSVRVYEPHPKPVGIAFGGTLGNERVFIDEDFSRLTIRHHAVDKTYQPGPLFPNQGFLPAEAFVWEVEVWGLGGRKVKEVQTKYKKREDLFTEQRRKVDLKTFANWEDSPEKMMMDMVSDPNRVTREDR